jgi:hypothetical protein
VRRPLIFRLQEVRLGNDQIRARVFISCGQSKQSDEVQIAEAISNRIRQLGFDPYIAVAEQSLRGLKENIFAQLRGSEYFIFVDFKRERLDGTEDYRGSLFSHQELAIASFLDVDVIAFQENGIKRNDGLIQFLQTNAISFTDKHTLPNVVADTIAQRGWKSNWRNELVLERDPRQFSDANQFVRPGLSQPARFFHIDVRNRHREKLATNCYVYLDRVVRLPDTEVPLKTVEFKWAGVSLPSVAIVPNSSRAFDAFHIWKTRPTQVLFNAYSDSTNFHPTLPVGTGIYELSYLVVAENFPPARGRFVLDLQETLDQTTLKPKQ